MDKEGYNRLIEASKGFEEISLGEMSKIKLMNRVDTKYITSFDKAIDLLELMKKHYYVLSINDKRALRYNNIYYDTIDYEMHRDHHNRRLPRQKVRVRKYLDSGEMFLEIKNKTNKRRTIKKRIKIESLEDVNNNAGFLEEYSNYRLQDLSPSIENKFYRLSLASKSLNERLTIDFFLNFYNHRTEMVNKLSGISIIELKQEGRAISKAKELFLKLRIKQNGFSKAAIGQSITNPNAKQNRFKSKINYIWKLQN